tara:strand:+ start:17685 stop:18194 length:510 start_codon:yes stop_codon:yes gene_type:complete
MDIVAFVLSIANVIVLVAAGLTIRSYLSSYLIEKSRNLASKEDIEEITKKLEGVKSQFAQEAALLEKRRAVYENIAISMRVFIAGHPADDAQKDSFLSAYASAWLWAPDQLLTALNIFLELQKAIKNKTTSEAQRQLKGAFGEVILEMRKDVVSQQTNQRHENYTFVQF